MIKSIRIRGFRSIKDVTLDVRPLTVLIGANQSGKTNLLEALDLVAKAAAGRLSQAIYHERGGMPGLLWSGPEGRTTSFGFEFDLEPTPRFGADVQSVRYEFTVEPLARGHSIANECLRILREGVNHFPIDAKVPKRGALRIYDVGRIKETKDEIPNSNDQELAIAQPSQGVPAVEEVRRALLPILVYPGFDVGSAWGTTDPGRAAQSRLPQTVQRANMLSARAENLVNVLYQLSSEEPERWRDFLATVRVGFPDLKEITFPPDAGMGRIALFWHSSRAAAPFSADALSQGTLGFLALGAALTVAPRPGLLAFDEPDAHMHPELIYRAVGWIEKTASPERPIILATHSDRLLTFLSDPSVVAIVKCDDQGTHIVRPDQEDLKDWLKDYTLGQLREMGHLERFGETTNP